MHEILWMRYLAGLFGITFFAIQTVVSTFFAGIALGAFLYARMSRNGFTGSFRFFALLEIAIAAWALIFPLAVRLLTPMYDRLAPAELTTAGAFAARCAIALIVLLVPTVLMGMTFPLAVELAGAGRKRIGTVYAINTAGAAAGVWFVTFAFIPRFGVGVSLAAAAAINLASAGIAMAIARRDLEKRSEASPSSTQERIAPGAAALLFMTGLIALALQMVWTRALEQILSGTIYTFATVLTVYLLGISSGSALLRLKIVKRLSSAFLLCVLLGLLAVAVGITPGLLSWWADVRTGMNETAIAGTAPETIVAALLLLVPTTMMGMIFPLAITWASVRCRAESVGRLTAANTFGSIVGPIIAAALVIPLLGIARGLFLLAAMTALITLLVAMRTSRNRYVRIAAVTPLLVVVGLFAIERGSERLQGERVLALREDAQATVAVVENDGAKRLRVNNSYSLGGGHGVFTERRQGHIPMLLHPDPRRVLVLGIGTGNTLGAVALHRPERLVGVELLDGVIDMAAAHFGETNFGVIDSGDAEIVVGDAIRAVRSSDERFDLVIGDLFHPWQAGVGSLYSREHFSNVERILASGGLMVQWLPLYQLSSRDLRCITRTFLEVFPDASLWFGNYTSNTPIVALVGGDGRAQLSEQRMAQAFSDERLAEALQQVYLGERFETAAARIAGPELLAKFAGGAPVNTFLQPRVEFSAPHALSARSLEREKTEMLIELLQLAAAEDDRSGLTGETREARVAVRAMVLGLVLLERGDPDSAVSALELTADRSRDYPLAYRVIQHVGERLLDQRPELAERLFARAAANRDESALWAGLGSARTRLGRSPEAAAAFSRALLLDPQNSEALAAIAATR